MHLTAFASSAVDGSGYQLSIFGFVPGELPQQVAGCASGSSCPATVLASDQPVFYQAFVNVPGSFESVAVSNQVTIPSAGGDGGGGEPGSWSVSLMVSPTLLPRATA